VTDHDATAPSSGTVPTTMRAVTQERFGDPARVLSPTELPTPSPAPGEVLVRVEAISINAYDWHMVGANPAFVRLAGYGFTKPKYPIPGRDVAGVVVAVGSDETGFEPGDRVFGWHNGTAAEYIAAKAAALAPIPDGVSFETASAVPLAGFTALQSVRDHGRVTAGSKVLVLGASGGVGQFVVQMAKAMGAEVTGVCGTHNLEVVRGIGADHVVDYSQDDVYALDERFDVVIHVNGTYPLKHLRRIMTEDGVLVLIGSDEGGWLLGPARFIFGQVLRARFVSQSVAQFTAVDTAEDLAVLADMLADGSLTVAIDHLAPLEGIGAEISELRRGHARGKVVIDVGT
jgi:NADPH:quinone reductase-like Zn-dependent oxidoreductase